MNLVVLLLCMGFSNLLCLGNGNSEDASNSIKPVDASLEQEIFPESEAKHSIVKKDLYSSNQLTTDGRIGELELSGDSQNNVDVIWKIPNVFSLPYRPDAGIASPDINSLGFKGYLIMDPKGSMDTVGAISFNSFLLPRNGFPRKIHLEIFLKAEDGSLKSYDCSVSFRSYFTCNVAKADVTNNKETMVPGDVLTILFRLRLTDLGSSGNPEVTPSLASMYDVGDLHGRRVSPSKYVMTWMFPDFFSLPEYRHLTGSLPQIAPYYFFHIYMTPKGIFSEAGFTRLQLSWRYKGDVPPEKLLPYPEFSCKFSLKTEENTLYNITGEKYHVALRGGFCFCLIPQSEIYEKKDFLVPGGKLSLNLNLESKSKEIESETTTASIPEREEEWTDVFTDATETETKASTDDDILKGRIGELEISRGTTTSTDITWTINNYFTLPYKVGSGILSPDFSSLGFKGFFVMDPRGSATTPGDLQFRNVIFRHDGKKEIYLKLFLKMANGTFNEFNVKEMFNNFFTSDIPKRTIADDKEIMAPGDVLTVLFRLSTTGKFADNLKRDCHCTSEEKEFKVCDSPSRHLKKLSHDFLELYKSGERSDVTLKCRDAEFAVHKSILSTRSPVFAEMFKRHEMFNATAGGQLNELESSLEIADAVGMTYEIKDIKCSILDLLLQFVYSAHVGNIPTVKKQQMLDAFRKYGIELFE